MRFFRLWLIFLKSSLALDLIILSIGSKRFENDDRRKTVVLQHCRNQKITCKFFHAVDDFLPYQGMWTIFPTFRKISFLENSSSWLLIVEESSHINIENFVEFAKNENQNQEAFFGFQLKDSEPTIIHHFGFGVPSDFGYPLFAAGSLISPALLRKIVKELDAFQIPSFSIDAKYELAQILRRHFDSAIIRHYPSRFCLNSLQTCLVTWQEPNLTKTFSDPDIHVMIKTFSENHNVRLPVLKLTWTGELEERVEYCSDIVDERYNTISMGVGNTERGHCAKTWAILKRFKERSGSPWLFVADDDTLVAWERLKTMVARFDSTEKIIIGERYGYGFQIDGSSGYDYPTGGAGMVFTRSAIDAILKVCPDCPAADDPDDMVLGMCALIAEVPIIHESRMHQARPQDYDQNYLRSPITFHKFTEIDPIEVYRKYLTDENYVKNEL